MINRFDAIVDCWWDMHICIYTNINTNFTYINFAPPNKIIKVILFEYLFYLFEFYPYESMFRGTILFVE